MKFTCSWLFIAMFLFININSLSAQKLDWGYGFGGSGSDFGTDIALDDSGNVYTVGFFNNTVDFDPGPGVFNLTSLGSFDMYVLKLDSSGNFVWALSFGSNQTEGVYSIKYAGGNIFITGTFEGTIDFDPGSGIASHTASSGNIFLLTLTTQGDLNWVNTFGSTGNDYGYSIVIDDFHNIYLAGIYFLSVDFDPGPGIYTLTASGNIPNSFLCKFTSNGNLIWAKSSGGPGECIMTHIVYDTNGFIYSTGYFKGTADFDTGPGLFNLTSMGTEDIFISKHDSAGNFIWAKSYGGNSNDRGNAIAIEPNGNVNLLGYFQNSINLNPSPGSGFNLTSPGGYDIFLLKLSANGMFVQAGHISGPNIDFAPNIILDGNNNLLIAGIYRGTTDFDPDTLTTLYQTTGNGDIFILQLDTLYNPLWLRSIVGTSQEDAKSLEIDQYGSIYLTGSFQTGTIDLDLGPGIHEFIAGPSLRDIFLVKYAACPLNGSVVNLTSCDSVVSPSGTFIWTTSGTYFDVIPDMYGCDSTLTVNVIINANDSVTQNGTLLSSVENNATWQWVNCTNNFAVITGATGQNFTATSTGSYAVIVNSAGCSDTSNCFQVNFTGIPNSQHFNSFTISPNPASEKFQISFPKREKNIAISIKDIKGGLIYEAVFKDAINIQINTSDFQKGIYFIKVTGDIFEQTRKLVITGNHQ